jgi:hypothetical protein
VTLIDRAKAAVDAIHDGDNESLEQAILRLSKSRRWLAPLALAVGACAMLFNGLKLVFSNWRLTLLQVLPAVWIWLAMLDLKLHVLHGNSFHSIRGWLAVLAILLITLITSGCFFLNAIFGFVIVAPRPITIREAADKAKAHLPVILCSGAVLGVMLGFSTIVVARWGRPWPSLTLGIVVGLISVCYVAIPSRLIGAKPAISRKDKLVASAVTGTLGAAVCTPPYALGRLGILMLGSKVLFIPGVILVVFGFGLQAGANGAVRAVSMSSTLLASRTADAPTKPHSPRAGE